MQPIPIFSLATKNSGLACPRCASTAFHKYGKHLGIQRYKCTCCRRTFNETVNTPLHGIHDKQKMQEYLLTMRDQQSIRAASKQLGISVPTSFSWRHRILASLNVQSAITNSAPAAISEIKLPHSFKGRREKQEAKVPDTHSLLISDARGIPCLQLLVKTKKTSEAALLITNKIGEETKIEVVKTNLLSRAARKIAHKKIQNRSETQYLKKQVADTIGKLIVWMSRFNGVATKYLQQYWNWYRAEYNSPNFDHFRTECFGQRQLPYFR